MTTLLTPTRAADLRSATLTYEDVGATASGFTPPGYTGFSRTEILGEVSLGAAAQRLMTWQVHERTGLRVAASRLRVTEGDVVEMRLGFGRVSLRIPCRVVYTIEEADRIGFAYGTLPGHPESGEELFVLESEENRVLMTIRAFSRPGTRVTALAGPIGRQMQQVMTSRYLRAAKRAGREAP